MDTLTEPIEVRILAGGPNFLTIASLVATAMNGYYSDLPAGSTVALVTANPGEMAMRAPELIAEGRYHLGITTPTWYAKMAIDGTGPFSEPLPISLVASFPHDDRLVFAVKRSTGITSLHDIRERKYPLRLSTPPRDMLHPGGWASEIVLGQYGISYEDIESWGGEILRDRPKYQNQPGSTPIDPSFDAVFDEAIITRRWKFISDNHDLRFLPIDEDVLQKCEAMGMKRGVIPKDRLRGVDEDVPCIDFQGWALIIHADAPEELGYLVAKAIDERAEMISDRFDDGPFASLTSRISMPELIDTDLPVHPGVLRYFTEKGYAPHQK